MKRFSIMIMTLGLVAGALLTSCQKNELKSGLSETGRGFSGNTYDYLKSKPGIFDSLLFVIDRLKLADVLKSDSVTLFAVTNTSFRLASDDLNAQRLRTGKKPIYLKDYRLDQLDSLMCRYILKGTFSSKKLSVLNGITVFAHKYGYELNAKATASSAMGQVGAGPSSIVYSSKNRTEFKANWSSAIAYSIDIPTRNGLVHVIDDKHFFGFGYYSKQPSTPFRDFAFRLPETFDMDSEPLEAEDYDNGGCGVAYHDTRSPCNEIDGRYWNDGGQYRTGEGVDIWGQPAAYNKGIFYRQGYRIGAMRTGEWTNYSIEVPADGNYEIKLHYSVQNSTGNPPAYCDLRLDWKLLARRVALPITAGKMDELKAGTFSLTKGIHYLTFCTMTSVPDLSFDAFVFKRVN
ncbi:fasciclin domain-containing protein [Pedobacter vanadiisoli]|uniref:Fasciclin domain-containing protein n=1 Tax=Pedobacter vanadiisoli TaxID=1761975 RepID=A0ABW5MJ02_9SPHI